MGIGENREKLEMEEVQEISTSEERETIEKLLTEVYNWFDEDGWEADEATLKKKLKSLKESMKEINARLSEAKERPKAIEGMLQSLNLSTMFSTAMLAVPDSKEIYSEKDIKDLEKLMTETRDWFMGTWKKRNDTAATTNPVLLVKGIHARQGKLDREVAYLINKAKYHVPKPSNSTAKANATKDEKTTKHASDDAKKTGNEKSDAKTPESQNKTDGDTGKEDKVADSGEKKSKSTNENKSESPKEPVVDDAQQPQTKPEQTKNSDDEASAEKTEKVEL